MRKTLKIVYFEPEEDGVATLVVPRCITAPSETGDGGE